MQLEMQVEDATWDATGKQLEKDASSKCKTRQKLQNKALKMQKCKSKTPETMRLESKTPDKAEAGKRRNLRLGVGLGAAGLASGLAASHFERFGVWW